MSTDLKILGEYGWEDAFCGEGTISRECQGDWSIPFPALPSNNVDLSPVLIGDVEEIYQAEEGDHDGPDWIMYGRLKDGRYFGLEAGCDYTGWD